jgi:hypothetical protein
LKIKTGNVDNPTAFVDSGKRCIITTRYLLSKAVKIACGGISVLAHEIGSSPNCHTLTGTGSLPLLELEADVFSGYVLRKMGATLTESQAARTIFHPSQGKRLASIEKGWLHTGDRFRAINKKTLAKRKPYLHGQ